MAIEVVVADYTNKNHAADLVSLLNDYANDPMGGSESLSAHAKQNLAAELNKIPHAFSVICYVDDKPAGFANCFEAFSTFACAPLVNIHDLAVNPDFRGLQISQKLLNKVEEIATEKNCCKVTLEVLEGNEIAKNAYLKYGFKPYQLDNENGNAMFWQKPIK